MTDLLPMKVGLSRRRPNRPRPRQAGAATLAVAVIMLLVVSVLVFHSHTAGWLEQRATSNQTRAKQAHAAAEAGLDAALSVLNADAGVPNRATHLTAAAGDAGRFTILNNTLAGSPGGGLAYSVTIARVGTDPSPYARLQLTANGGSECSNVADVTTCSGQAIVRQVIEIEPLLPYQPGSPPPPTRSTANFDTVFGAPQATIKALTTPVPSGASFTASTAGLVWHQGNLTLVGAVGSDASPVLLVVEGDLTIPAGADVRGFVFATGNVTCNACSTPSIRGALATAGTHNLTDSPPDPQVVLPVDPNNGSLARLSTTAFRFAKVIGTWRDW